MAAAAAAGGGGDDDDEKADVATRVMDIDQNGLDGAGLGWEFLHPHILPTHTPGPRMHWRPPGAGAGAGATEAEAAEAKPSSAPLLGG